MIFEAVSSFDIFPSEISSFSVIIVTTFVSPPKPAPSTRRLFCHDHVQMLFLQLLSGILDQVLCLHGKSAQELPLPLMLSEIRQDIVCPLKFQRQLSAFFLDFSMLTYFGR